MARRKYEEIKNIVSRRNKPTRQENELISLIFNKMVNPYYYWTEAKTKIESEASNREDVNKSGAGDFSEIAKKYDLDTGELNANPSRIKVKKYIDVGFRELSSQMTRRGYSYDRESRSFVRKR
jgi:hypothetical protein